MRGGEPLLRTGGMFGSGSAYGKAPTRVLHSIPIAVSGSGHIGTQINSFDAVILMQESPPHKRFLVECSSPHRSCDSPNTSRRFELGAIIMMSAWSAKNRRAPSWHCRDARAYGHTTTPMRDNESTPASSICKKSAPETLHIGCNSLSMRLTQYRMALRA